MKNASFGTRPFYLEQSLRASGRAECLAIRLEKTLHRIQRALEGDFLSPENDLARMLRLDHVMVNSPRIMMIADNDVCYESIFLQSRGRHLIMYVDRPFAFHAAGQMNALSLLHESTLSVIVGWSLIEYAELRQK